MAPSPQFDIFSGDRDKDARWIEAVEGFAKAKKRMLELAAQKAGRYFIFDTQTNKVVASIEPVAERKNVTVGRALD